MFKAGQPRPQNAGRRKGTPNKATQELRDTIRAALGGKSIAERMMQIAKEKPMLELQILTELLPYESPKLTSTTIEADVTNHDGDKESVDELAAELEANRGTLSLVKPGKTG